MPREKLEHTIITVYSHFVDQVTKYIISVSLQLVKQFVIISGIKANEKQGCFWQILGALRHKLVESLDERLNCALESPIELYFSIETNINTFEEL